MPRSPEANVPLERHRALAQRYEDAARRLADHEYRAMRDALQSGHAFKVPRIGAAERLPAALSDMPLSPKPPPLQVPLARIAAHPMPDSLPCVGVILTDSGPETVEALLGLIQELNRSAFARILFMPRCLSFIPFLAKYGFPCQGVGDAPTERIGALFAPRFDMKQIRDLKTGEILWRHP